MPIPVAPVLAFNVASKAAGIAGSEYSNRKAFERMRKHDIEMFNMSVRDRDAQNRYNAPSAQVARLAAAGINPASVFGAGSMPAESSSVSGDSGASSSGVDYSVLGRDGIESFLIPKQIEQMQANIDLTKAQKDRAEADTANTEENTRWISARAQADIDSKRANAELSRGRFELLKDERNQILANIEKLRAEADSEVERQYLFESQRLLNDASVRELNALLPYKKLLMQAQTENQKAQAGLALANKMYQEGLIDVGYIDALFDKVVADTRLSGSSADKNEFSNWRSQFKNCIITGEGYEGVGGFLKNCVYSAGLLVGSFIPGASNSWID